MEKKVYKEKKHPYKKLEDIIQAENLMNSGKYNDALLLLNNLEEIGGLNPSDLLDCHLIQSSILYKLGNYQKCYHLSEKAYHESQNLKSYFESIEALVNMSYALVWLGDLDKADNLIVKSENLLSSLNEESPSEIEQREASIAFGKALLSWFRGDMNQSLEYGKKSLNLREKFGNKHEIVESLNAIGFAYSFLKCDLDTALQYAKRCQVLAEEINHQQMINFNYLNLGIIYNLKGEYDKALIYHKKCLPFFEESNNIVWTSATINNISIVYLHQSKFDSAVDFLKKGLNLALEIGNSWLIAISLCNLIGALILKGDIDNANKYLEELKQLNNQENNKWIDMAYLVSKAEILKQSPRLHDRTKAEKILKQVIKRELITNLDINIEAIVNLCELLLDELRITNDIGVLDDLNPYIRQLLGIAEKTNSFWILTETYVLQAKLALLTLDLKGARRLLTQAQRIAEKHGMNRLAAKVSIEHDELLQKLSMWEKLKDSESSLSERFKLTKVTEQMKNMIQKRRSEFPEILDENPVMILVISQGGVPTFSKLFAEKFVVEDDLISSFLATFNSFSGELFSEGLDRASFGEFTLLMKPISTFLVCYLFKGQSFSAKKRIQNFVETIEKNKELLEKFNEYYKTNQVIKLEDVPLLNSIITEIFIEKSIPENIL